MRLALLGHPIQHSLSPTLYQEFLGGELTSYELLDLSSSAEIPPLSELAMRLDGLNITSPYKEHFLSQVKITSPLVQKIGAINTISFSPEGPVATNTDVLAVEHLLKELLLQFPGLEIHLLGSGVMARVTVLVAEKLQLKLKQYSRNKGDALENLDLSGQSFSASPLIINACSRSFIFQGKLPEKAIFWDYNYNFTPHQTMIPARVHAYIDGKELLRRQALSAIEFWYESNPKLKC